MSWREISREEFDRIMPVRPPMVNKRIKPIAHRWGPADLNLVAKIVANHLKTLIPVGTAIIMVVAVKYPRVSTSMPTVNMW